MPTPPLHVLQNAPTHRLRAWPAAHDTTEKRGVPCRASLAPARVRQHNLIIVPVIAHSWTWDSAS